MIDESTTACLLFLVETAPISTPERDPSVTETVGFKPSNMRFAPKASLAGRRQDGKVYLLLLAYWFLIVEGTKTSLNSKLCAVRKLLVIQLDLECRVCSHPAPLQCAL